MLGKLLLLFIVVPLIELALILYLAHLTSLLFTLLLVILTGILGAWLARRQGWHTLQRIQSSLGAGQMPTDAVIDAVFILVAGAMLLTPGILTDALGFVLLIPAGRKFVREFIVRRFRGHFTVDTVRSDGDTERDQVIDSYVVDKQSESKRNGYDDHRE